jgi:hypothetical protein
MLLFQDDDDEEEEEVPLVRKRSNHLLRSRTKVKEDPLLKRLRLKRPTRERKNKSL